MSSQPSNTNTTSQPDGYNASNTPFFSYVSTLGLFTPRHRFQHIRPDYRQIPPPPPSFTATHTTKKSTMAPKKQPLQEVLREVREKGRKVEPSLVGRTKKYCANRKYGCERFRGHKTEECEMSAAEREEKKAEMKVQRQVNRDMERKEAECMKKREEKGSRKEQEE